MRTIDIEYDLPARPDSIFALMTDFEHLGQWRSIAGIRVEPPGPISEGTRVTSTISVWGVPLTVMNEVTELDPVRRIYRDRFVGGRIPVQGVWQVSSHAEGARVTWHTEYEGRSVLRPFGFVIGRVIRVRQLQDLATLARHLVDVPRAGR